MSTQQPGTWDDDDDDDVTTDETPERDSSAMRALRKADRAKAKRISELEERLSAFEASERSRSVEKVLLARSLSPKIAGLIPSSVEPTEDAVGAWLDEFGDVFAGGGQKAQVDPEQDAKIAAMRQMDDVGAALNTPAALLDISAQINAAQTREELDALIFGGGAGR